MRHPWLWNAQWFVEATDLLMSRMIPGSSLIIGMDKQRERDTTFGVHIESLHTQDEIDDMPGIRKIERRAGELLQYAPMKEPCGLRLTVTRTDMVAELKWHYPGRAYLVSHKREDGWHSADIIEMPARYLALADSDLLTKDSYILYELDRVLGRGKLDHQAYIHSATRRGEEIRVVIGAGGILHPGSSEMA
jgi:hypothetical protein